MVYSGLDLVSRDKNWYSSLFKIFLYSSKIMYVVSKFPY